MIGPGAHWDHTWVTSYDNRAHPYRDTAAVELAGQDYWYCWGGFYQRGGTPSPADGLVGLQAGRYDAARCLAGSNVDCSVNFAARGTIFTYGVDGICHQLANQVLYATALGGAEPLTVSQANGYWVSCGIYGAYGLQHSAWRNKIAICATLEAPSPSNARGRKLSDDAIPVCATNSRIMSARSSAPTRRHGCLCSGRAFRTMRRLMLTSKLRSLRTNSTPAISVSWTTPRNC